MRQQHRRQTTIIFSAAKGRQRLHPLCTVRKFVANNMIHLIILVTTTFD